MDEVLSIFKEAILSMNESIMKHEYREHAIQRYLNKRKNRVWRKEKNKSMKRNLYDYKRDVKGRFSRKWISITCVC